MDLILTRKHVFKCFPMFSELIWRHIPASPRRNTQVNSESTCLNVSQGLFMLCWIDVQWTSWKFDVLARPQMSGPLASPVRVVQTLVMLKWIGGDLGGICIWEFPGNPEIEATQNHVHGGQLHYYVATVEFQGNLFQNPQGIPEYIHPSNTPNPFQHSQVMLKWMSTS